jgi:predicted transcriptional regulator
MSHDEAMRSKALAGILTEPEISILRSATEKGLIRIPNGTAMEIDECRDLLAGLQKAGLVSRNKDAGYYSHFRLTDAGRNALPGMQAAAEKK